MDQPPALPPENENPYSTPDTQPPAQPQPKAMGEDLGMRVLLPVGRSGWAIAAGYLGLFGLVLFPAPIALIVSIIAVRDIKKSKASGKQKYGMGRAIFGLVIGIIGTVLLGLLLLKMSTT